MKKEERQILIERYNKRLKKYGHDPRTLGWFKGRQDIRFKVLSEISDLNNCSILDVGCGFGDLYGFLMQKNLNIEYVGIDINQNLVEIARKTYPGIRFEVIDFQKKGLEEVFDWVFSSGVFNYKLHDTKFFMQDMLRKMFRICTKGIASDFISNYTTFKNKITHYTSPEEIFSYCKTLSKRVVLRHDYMPFEFCIYIYKDDSVNEQNVFADFDRKNSY